MGWAWSIGKRAFFALDPERAHHLALTLLGLPAPWRWVGGAAGGTSSVDVHGLPLANRIGLAGGFDKACARMAPLGRLGFGYVVGGTVTLAPRAGNPRPRIARTRADRALVNAMGLPNPGAAEVARALARTTRTTSRWVSLADEALEDVLRALDLVAPYADAIELNASSPNAGWQHRADHVGVITEAAARITDRPVIVKLPPYRDDGARDGVLAMARAARDGGAAGLTCANTLPVEDARMPTGRGGLSGGPLTSRTPAMVREVGAATGLPVHACGGVMTAADARACLEAGAATVQIYTALIYEGPRVVGRLAEGTAG
ncbi:MAG TPA: dihydroorotate dehydrogenase 2 [Actinomycetota bacterium]|nr:dihydroorotate dehydrogenase 2 [Actinomycetota bacterium]